MFVRRPRHSQIQNWHVNEHCMQPCSLSGALCNGSRERPLAELWDKFKWSDWALLPALSPSSAPLQVGLLSQLQMTHAVPERQSFPTQRESSLQVAEYLKKITIKGGRGTKINICECWTAHAETVVHHPHVKCFAYDGLAFFVFHVILNSFNFQIFYLYSFRNY